MVNDPYKIERQINNMIEDRKYWLQGKKYTTLNKKEFDDLMLKKYSYLKLNNDLLYNKVLSGFFDKPENLNMINMMLMLSKDIYNGKRHQDDVDKKLGTLLANKYVNPLVEKINKEKEQQEQQQEQ